jgi:peptidoglycan/LPS O-acetylase OafA/YrhL
MQYRAEIDGLRCLAVMPVILFHAGFEALSGGFVGVDLFFVISGYLITTIILTQLAAGTFSFADFYERRARRILPALFMVLLSCLPFAYFWLAPSDLKTFAQSLVAVIFFGSNFLFWKTSGYFDTASDQKPLLHTWSLAVEEQYYLLFPILLLLLWRFGKNRIGLLFYVGTLSSFVIAQLTSVDTPDFAFYLLPTRTWELLIGAIAALWISNGYSARCSPVEQEAGASLGLAMIVCAIIGYDRHLPYPGMYALLPTIGAALIILHATPATAVGRLLGRKELVGIGLISYSAYLWHQPLLAFARYKSTGELAKSTTLALVLVTLVLAFLTWKHIEAPFRDRKKIGRRQIGIFASAGSALFIVVGVAGHLTKGFSDLKTSDEHLAVLGTATASPRRAECHSSDTHYLMAKEACSYDSGPAKWAVFGDSHAVELAYELGKALEGTGASLRQYSYSGCVPTFGRTVDGKLKKCSEWTNQTVEHIANDRDMQYVVVSYRIHGALFGSHESAFPRMPHEVSGMERERRWNSLVAMLRMFVAKDKKVFLVLQAPELPKPINQLVMKAAHPLKEIPGVSGAWWRERSSFVAARMSQIPGDVEIIDPVSLFCHDGQCFAGQEGKAFYFDDNHLSLDGAAMIAEKILQQAVTGKWQSK